MQVIPKWAIWGPKGAISDLLFVIPLDKHIIRMHDTYLGPCVPPDGFYVQIPQLHETPTITTTITIQVPIDTTNQICNIERQWQVSTQYRIIRRLPISAI